MVRGDGVGAGTRSYIDTAASMCVPPRRRRVSASTPRRRRGRQTKRSQADLDVKCRRSWAPVLATCPEIAVARADQRFVSGAFLSTDLMVARPGHPLLAQILKEMPRKARSARRFIRFVRVKPMSSQATSWMAHLPPYLAVMLTTGPWHLSNEFLAYTEQNPWPAGALQVLGDGPCPRRRQTGRVDVVCGRTSTSSAVASRRRRQRSRRVGVIRQPVASPPRLRH